MIVVNRKIAISNIRVVRLCSIFRVGDIQGGLYGMKPSMKGCGNLIVPYNRRGRGLVQPAKMASRRDVEFKTTMTPERFRALPA